MPNNDDFFRQSPNQAKLMAFEIASEATGGREPNRDEILAAARSDAFEQRRQSLFSEDSLNRLDEPVPDLRGGSSREERDSVFGPTAGLRKDILRGVSDAYQSLSRVGETDRAVVKRKIVRELNPYEDIDSAIHRVKTQWFADRALEHEKLAKAGIPPSRRRAIVAERGKGVSDDVTRLLQTRKERESKIDAEVDEMISSANKNERSAQLKLQALRDARLALGDAEDDRKAQAFLELDIDKAEADLAATRRRNTRAGTRSLGDQVSGDFSQEELNVFDLMASDGIETKEDAAFYLEDQIDTDLDFGQRSNLVARYMAWLKESREGEDDNFQQTFAGGSALAGLRQSVRFAQPDSPTGIATRK